jgi:hypothetical protein
VNRVEPPENMRRWANQVAKQHPQVSEVLLVGDPATSWCRPFWNQPRPGWDVIIRLAEAVYAEQKGEGRQLEQHLAFDPAVRFEGLNLLFLRPEGRPGWWAWPAGKPPIWVQQTPLWMRRPLLAGDTLGDLGPFRKGCTTATVLYSATGEPVPIFVGGNGQRKGGE